MINAAPARTPKHRLMSFGELDLGYDDRVLAPREWTTLHARWAAALCDVVPEGPVLELCCGAGQKGY